MTDYVYRTTFGKAATRNSMGHLLNTPSDPVPPNKLRGWELLATVAVQDTLHWTWRRAIVRRKKKS